MVEWVVYCTALGRYRTSGSVLHPRRMLDFMPFDVFEVRSGPLYFFFSSSSFYLLELLPAPPLCAEWVVNT